MGGRGQGGGGGGGGGGRLLTDRSHLGDMVRHGLQLSADDFQGAVRELGLTELEAASLISYTLDSRQINRALNADRALTQVEAAYARQLNKALNKLPPISNKTVWRGTDRAFDVKAGQTLKFKGFTSTSGSQRTAKDFGSQTVFKITTKSKGSKGRAVEKLSTLRQQEVLFKSGSRFRVNRVRQQGGSTVVELSEL